MRRKALLAGPVLLPALLMISCNRECLPSPSPTPQEQRPAITFDALQSKAGEQFSLGDTFIVWATAEDGEEIMNGQVVTLTASGWTYAPLKFWPKDTEVDFYAISPGNPDLYDYDAWGRLITISVPDDAATDFMSAVPVTASEGETVVLQFTHTMARIAISGKLLSSPPLNRGARIKRITLNQHPSEGEWMTELVGWHSYRGNASFTQYPGAVITSTAATRVSDLFLIPTKTSSSTGMVIEWETIYTPTGATIASETSSVPFRNKTLAYGKQSDVTFTLDVRQGVIIFEDSRTKRICVAAYDSNQDGEISYEEAAAVTNLGTTFQGRDIGRFKELQFFSGVSSLQASCFQGCSNLEAIVLPPSVTTLPDQCFDGCGALAEFTLPQRITTLGTAAFRGCASLPDQDLTHLTRIGSEAFKGCSSLTAITLSEGCTNIGTSLFEDCTALREAVLLGTRYHVPDKTFKGCRALQAFDIPVNTLLVGAESFYGCSALEEIDLPASVQEIGDRAFAGCSHVATIRSRPQDAPATGDRVFGWSDETSGNLKTGAEVTGEKLFIILLSSRAYGTGPWVGLQASWGYRLKLVLSF